MLIILIASIKFYGLKSLWSVFFDLDHNSGLSFII